MGSVWFSDLLLGLLDRGVHGLLKLGLRFYSISGAGLVFGLPFRTSGLVVRCGHRLLKPGTVLVVQGSWTKRVGQNWLDEEVEKKGWTKRVLDEKGLGRKRVG